MSLKEFDYEKEPVVSIVKKILIDAINMKASDIHFDPTSTELSIKFRINGSLQEYTVAPESVKSNITTRVKILSNMNITDTMHPQTGIINIDIEGKHHNMSVSSLPICDGEKIVLHISNYENNIKSLSKMGINPEDTDKIKRLVKNTQGLVLITGTTSSGKTTTMYSMLKEIASKSINIISIEEPVKLKLADINQVEISPDKGITYKNALKYAMLQDPNVICIDNLIDDEIARDAIRASITGRLVISSLYTKNAYTTIDSLLNMDIENYLLGSNLNGIISQRLVKELCPKCKEKRVTTEYEKNILKQLLNVEVNELYYPKGCNECHKGYINQIPIVEVIEVTDEIKSAITNKKDRKTIRNLLYKNNNTILVNGFNKVIDGTTSFNEIIRIIDVKNDLTEDQKELKEYILGNGIPTIDNIPEPTPVEEQIIQQVTEEVNNEVQEINEQPIVEEVNNEVQNFEEQPIIEEVPEEQPQETEVEQTVVETPVEPTTEPVPEIKLPTEGQRLIDEISEMFGEEIGTFNSIEKDEIQIEQPQEIIEEQPVEVVEEPSIEEIEQELMEQPIVEEVSEEQPQEIVEEQPVEVNEEHSIEEIEQQLMEEPIIEEVSEEEPTENEIQEVQQEINVPTPIEANIVEQKPTPIEDDDEEDEDDFGYGEEYENSF